MPENIDEIDDISTRLKVVFYDEKDEFLDIEDALKMGDHRISSGGYSDMLAAPLNIGGKFLEIIYADEETYNELLEMAKPIPNKQDMYEVEFGYFPYEKVYKSKQEINQIMKNGIMTGRSYELRSGIYLEIEYAGERFVYDYEDKQIYSVKPIKWIIYTKKHKIISEKPIAHPYDYKVSSLDYTPRDLITGNSIDYTVKNQIYNNSVFGGIIRIEKGVLRNLNINNSHPNYKYINLPSFVTEVRSGIFPSEDHPSDIIVLPEATQEYMNYKSELKIHRGIEKFKTDGTTCARTVELYDNIRLDSSIRAIVKLIIHYESFESLLAFLDCNRTKLDVGREYKGKAYIYGKERLTPEQSEIIGKYIKYKWRKEPEEPTTIAFNLPEIIVEVPKETKTEEQPEEDKIQVILNKLYTYLAYYDNGEERINEIKQKVDIYNHKITDLENKFYSGIDTIETPDELYNALLYELELELSKVENGASHFKIIDLIDDCLKAMNEETEPDEELAKDLYKLSSIILPNLKDKYHKYYKETIISLLIKEKSKINDYLNNRLNSLEYNSAEEFEIYFRNLLHPLLNEINIAINDESIKRNFSKEIMDVTKNLMNSKFTEARQDNVIRDLEYLKEISINLDDKINESPFSKEFKRDKEKILSYARDIDKYYNDSNLKETIIASCQTLKKYLKRKPTEFEKIDELIKEIIKEDKINDKGILLFNQIINMQNEVLTYEDITKKSVDNTTQSFDINDTETKKIESALYQIIYVLWLLELEVDQSIEKQKSFERCKIRL